MVVGSEHDRLQTARDGTFGQAFGDAADTAPERREFVGEEKDARHAREEWTCGDRVASARAHCRPAGRARKEGSVVQATGLKGRFRTSTLRIRTFLRRFHRDPDAAAFEEIRARLETADSVADVTEAEVRSSADAWNVRLDGPLRGHMLGFYRAFLRRSLEDHRLTDAETADLDHLRRVFRLTPDDAELASRQVARETYSRFVDQVLADQTIDPQEREFLIELRDVLGLPDPIADNIETMKRRQRRAAFERRDRVRRFGSDSP